MKGKLLRVFLAVTLAISTCFGGGAISAFADEIVNNSSTLQLYKHGNASEPTGMTQSISVNASVASANNKTSANKTMRLYLWEVVGGQKVPCQNVDVLGMVEGGIEYPFLDHTANAPVKLTLVEKGNERYLEFVLTPGSSVDMELEFMVPNGISGNTDLRIEPMIVDAKPGDKAGGAKDLNWHANFEWYDLQKNVNVEKFDAKDTDATKARPVLEYKFDVHNAAAPHGVIWADAITVTDTVTLPEGFGLPGNVTRSGNKLVTADGKTVWEATFPASAGDAPEATISDIVVSQSNGVTQIVTTATVPNPYKNDETGKLANDNNPLLSWSAKLYTENLQIDTLDTTYAEREIVNTMQSTFKPCVPGVDPITLTDHATTIVEPKEAYDPKLVILKTDADTEQRLDMVTVPTEIKYEFLDASGNPLPLYLDRNYVKVDSADGVATAVYDKNEYSAVETFTTNASRIEISGIPAHEIASIRVKEVVAPAGYHINHNAVAGTLQSGDNADYVATIQDTKEDNGSGNPPEKDIVDNDIFMGKASNHYESGFFTETHKTDYYSYYVYCINASGLELDIHNQHGDKLIFESSTEEYEGGTVQVFTYVGIQSSSSSDSSIKITSTDARPFVLRNLPENGTYKIEEKHVPTSGNYIQSAEIGYIYVGSYEKHEVGLNESYSGTTVKCTERMEDGKVVHRDFDYKWLMLNNFEAKNATSLTINKVDAWGTAVTAEGLEYKMLDQNGKPFRLKAVDTPTGQVYQYVGPLELGDDPINAGATSVIYEGFSEKSVAGVTTAVTTKNGELIPVTSPGIVNMTLICKNEDQKPGGRIPLPYSLNYEINVYEGLGWTGWLDSSKPTFTKPGGDSESYTFEVTQEMLQRGGGILWVGFKGRASKYPDVPLEQLGQTMLTRTVVISKDSSAAASYISSEHLAPLSGNTITIVNLPDYQNDKYSYTIEETQAPTGYKKTDQITTVSLPQEGSETVNIENKGSDDIADYPKIYDLTFAKIVDGQTGIMAVDAVADKLISDAKSLKFEITDQNGQYVKMSSDYRVLTEYGKVQQILTYAGTSLSSSNSTVFQVGRWYSYDRIMPFIVRNLPAPASDSTDEYFDYIITEKEPPRGYNACEPLKLRIYKDYEKVQFGTSDQLDSGTACTQEKGEPIALGSSDTLVDKDTTSFMQNSHVCFRFDQKAFTVNNQKADPKPSEVLIEKRDVQNHLIMDADARFQILDHTGTPLKFSPVAGDSGSKGRAFEVADNGITKLVRTDGSGRIYLKNVPMGTYRLHEVVAPSGYGFMKDDVVFEVDGLGDVVSVVAQDPDYVFGSERFASSSWKKIEEVGNPENLGYSYYSTDGKDVAGHKNYIEVSGADKLVRYTLSVNNISQKAFEDMVIIDKLPEPNDNGVINLDEKRGSEFTVKLAADPAFSVYVTDENGAKNVVPKEFYKIDYTVADSYYDSEWNGKTDYPERWSTVATADTKAFRVSFTDDFVLPVNHSLFVEFTGKIQEDAKPGMIAWNNFGYRYYVGQTSLTPEPPKVGVKLPDPVPQPPADNPGAPNNPNSPNNPDNPNNPSNPDSPANPDKPNSPENPDKPAATDTIVNDVPGEQVDADQQGSTITSAETGVAKTSDFMFLVVGGIVIVVVLAAGAIVFARFAQKRKR